MALDLSHNELSIQCLEAIAAAVAKSGAFTALALENTGLGANQDQDAKIIADVMAKSTSLREANCGFNELGREGGKAFTEALVSTKAPLTLLDLATSGPHTSGFDCDITKAIVEAAKAHGEL